MSLVYELWDRDGANLINAYGTEEEALIRVRQAIARHGRTAVTTWVLLADDDDADTADEIAGGEALIERALAQTVPSAGGTARPAAEGAF